MLATQTLVHDEVDGSPNWTAEGDWSGNHSNVALSGGTTPDRSFVELFMTAPYHTLGILRPGVSTMAYSRGDDAGRTPYKSAAVLDVLSGYSAVRPSEPVVFPGNGSTIALDRFIAESPDPRTTCGWGGQTVGLPLLVLLPEDATSVSATLDGPNGPVETCVLSAANTGGIEQTLLSGDDAVIVVPHRPLVAGGYTARVTTATRSVGWSFGIDPSLRNAVPVALPDTRATATSSRFDPVAPVRLADSRRALGVAARLKAGVAVRLQVAGVGGIPANTTAVAANITAIGGDDAGYLTTYPCSATAPDVSTVNFGAGETVPNAAVIPLDASGGFCIVAPTAAHLLVDVSGVFTPTGGSGYRPVSPTRLVDTRTDGTGRLSAGSTLRVQVRGRAGISADASAVALNVTAAQPAGVGYVTAHPCADDGADGLQPQPLAGGRPAEPGDRPGLGERRDLPHRRRDLDRSARRYRRRTDSPVGGPVHAPRPDPADRHALGRHPVERRQRRPAARRPGRGLGPCRRDSRRTERRGGDGQRHRHPARRRWLPGRLSLRDGGAGHLDAQLRIWSDDRQRSFRPARIGRRPVHLGVHLVPSDRRPGRGVGLTQSSG